MSNNIGKNELSNFFIHNYQSNKISFADAKKLGIDVERFKDADVDDNQEFDIDEIADDKELYAAFTAIIEKDKEAPEVDAEKEKEENNKIQKGGNASNK